MPEGPPRYLEVFGMAAVESLLMGRPVIINSQGGGLLEIVEQGVSGYVVNGKDEFELAVRSILKVD